MKENIGKRIEMIQDRWLVTKGERGIIKKFDGYSYIIHFDNDFGGWESTSLKIPEGFGAYVLPEELKIIDEEPNYEIF